MKIFILIMWPQLMQGFFKLIKVSNQGSYNKYIND